MVMDMHGPFRRDELMLLPIATHAKRGIGLSPEGVRQPEEKLGDLSRLDTTRLDRPRTRRTGGRIDARPLVVSRSSDSSWSGL
jgi:hypothetical protein